MYARMHACMYVGATVRAAFNLRKECVWVCHVFWSGSRSGIQPESKECEHVCMYACMHVRMYAFVHVCIYSCMHLCMYAFMHVCMWVYEQQLLTCASSFGSRLAMLTLGSMVRRPSSAFACMYVCMYACIHACMHACMYECMHVCMHVCMYVCMWV